jgi:uncharacterized protein (DUF169 family)
MDMELRDKFISLWKKYFNNAELPLAFYYTDEEGRAELATPGSVSKCVIGALSSVRKERSLCFNVDSIGCFGGKRYLGFSEKLMPGFEYFLSCGIPGKLEGERYKKSPEIVKEMMKNSPHFRAPARFIVFKRWDMLDSRDDPDVVIFFAKPDVLSGLFTLANFDGSDPNGVIAPMGAGCNTIVQQPYLEKDSPRPRGVVGMFDISARPYVGENELTFSVPIKKFEGMMENIEESFLITNSWKTVQKRLY